MELRSPAEELRRDRHVDLQPGPRIKAPTGSPQVSPTPMHGQTAHIIPTHNHKDIRNFSTNTIATSPSTISRNSQLPGSLTFPLAPDNPPKPRPRIAPAKVPASNSRNGLLEDFWKGPPPAMITQGSYKIDTSSTKDWVASQQQQSLDISPTAGDGLPPPSPAQPLSARSATDSSGSRPLIKPIRGFKTSSRKSAEMAARRRSSDQDTTVRALEGYDLSKRASNQTEQDEHNSDDSDLFLRAAKEEELARHPGNDSVSRTDSRRVRHHSFIFHSLPPHYTFLLQVSCP